MAEYVLVYKGGNKVPEGEAEQQRVAAAWGKWFADLGDKVVNNGAPFGESKVVGSGGEVGGSSDMGLSGFSIVEADSLDEAVELAKGCPVLGGGASIEVYSTIVMM